MAKVKKKAPTNLKTQFGLPTTRPDAPPWQSTVGLYLSGQAEIDDLDALAIEMERKWGADRLRLLVDRDLRVKFDRQRYLINQAIWYGQLEDVRREARRMMAAWRVLDKAATEAGAKVLPPTVWEGATSKGAVVAIVQSPHDLRDVAAEGRHMAVYSVEDVVRLIEAFPSLISAKAAFPGATVTQVWTGRRDPLDAVPDSSAPLDDPIPF
jgi:hypothetical protein